MILLNLIFPELAGNTQETNGWGILFTLLLPLNRCSGSEEAFDLPGVITTALLAHRSQ